MAFLWLGFKIEKINSKLKLLNSHVKFLCSINRNNYYEPLKVLIIEILRCSVKNFARRQLDAALGVFRLRQKSVQLEKVQAIQVIREIL